MPSIGEPQFRSVRVRDRSGLRRAQRAAVVVAVVVVAALLAGVIGTWVVVSSRIDGTSVIALERDPTGELRNVVIALADQPQGPVDGVFLLQVGEPRDEPAVLVLPVNLEVDVADRGVLTIGAVADEGGMALLVEEVGEYTDLPIHHYVRVDRTALAAAVDRNGGITDCETPQALACPNVLGRDLLRRLAPPQDTVSGPDRVRALADATALVAGEVARPATLVNPRRALRWAGEWQDVLRTDLEPGALELRDIARQLAALDPDTLQVRVLPGLVDGGRLTVTPEEAAVLLDAFTTASPLPADVGLQPPRELAPQDVVVQVLNGLGEAGAAAEMADFLVDRGFTVADVDNAPRFSERAPTTIGYDDEEDRVVAELVASFLPGAEVEERVQPAPDGVDVVVTVGVGGTGG